MGDEAGSVVLILAGFATLAVLIAPLGLLPLVRSGGASVRWVGWANALAAGFMLGAAVVLADSGLDLDPLWAASGASAGILFVFWTHAVGGPGTSRSPAGGALRRGALHGASEGVALGAAMASSPALGVSLALTLALHNVPEAMALGATLRASGTRLRRAAWLTSAVNLGQLLLALPAYLLMQRVPAAHPAVAGFAVGALLHLVFSELLPESYRQAGQTSVALGVGVALGVVVLLGGGPA